MRLTRYLTEQKLNIPPEKVARILKAECRPYINLCKREGIDRFYRGMGYQLPKTFGSKKVRKDRISKGMTQETFVILNDWLQKNGHVRRDKSISATTNIGHASFFGTSTIIYPVGKFRYTWIEAEDINYPDNRTKWDPEKLYRALDISVPHWDEWRIKQTDEQIKKDFPKYFKTNSGIKIPWKRKFEIWFECNEYYYLDSGTQIAQSGEIEKLLGLKRTIQ